MCRYSLFSIAGRALESPMYETDSSVPDLMPSANPKSATLQLWDLTPDDDKASYLIRRGT